MAFTYASEPEAAASATSIKVPIPHNGNPGRKMNPVTKALWVHALRSGKYEQTDGYLTKLGFDDDGQGKRYCCLGVLCEVASQDTTPGYLEVSKKFQDGVIYYGYNGHADSGITPTPIAEWAGIDKDPLIPIAAVHQLQLRDPSAPQNYGKNDSPSSYTTLSVLNDRGFTFAHIADLIEECL